MGRSQDHRRGPPTLARERAARSLNVACGRLPSSGANRELTDKIRHELEGTVLSTAGAPGEISSSCEGRGGRFDCTVVYEGLPVRFRVEGSTSGMLFRYTVTPENTVLTRYGIHSRLTSEYMHAERIRCDELPTVFLAEVNRDLDQHCYIKIDGPRFKRVTIKVHSGGGYSFAF